MRTLSILLLILLNLTVTGAAAPEPAVKPPTLRTESRIPSAEFKTFFTTNDWAQVVDAPISGYVILKGTSDPTSRAVILHKQMISYPDSSRDARARNIAKSKAKRVKDSPRLPLATFPLIISGSSSMVSFNMDIYIVFYETSPKDWVALFYAKTEGGGDYFELVEPDRPRASGKRP